MQFWRWLDNYDREKNKQLVWLLSAEPQAWLKENLRQFERSLKNLKNATWPISVALFVKKWQRIEEKHNWLEKCNFSFFSSIMILVVTFWLQAYDSITRSVRRLVGWSFDLSLFTKKAEKFHFHALIGALVFYMINTFLLKLKTHQLSRRLYQKGRLWWTFSQI